LASKCTRLGRSDMNDKKDIQTLFDAVLFYLFLILHSSSLNSAFVSSLNFHAHANVDNFRFVYRSVKRKYSAVSNGSSSTDG
jgi:hypothetical protein